MHPINCRCVVCLVDRSSFGTDEAKAARESVGDEQAARVIQRAAELRECEERYGCDGRGRSKQGWSANYGDQYAPCGWPCATPTTHPSDTDESETR